MDADWDWAGVHLGLLRWGTSDGLGDWFESRRRSVPVPVVAAVVRLPA